MISRNKGSRRMRCTSMLVAVATFAGSVSAFMPATPVLRSSSSRHVALGNSVVGARSMPGAAVGAAMPVSGAPRSRQALSQLRMGDFCKVVSAEELEVAIQTSDTPLVVDFYTDWCGPCRLIAPQLEKVAQEYDGKVTFLKIDTDVYDDIASQLKVYALPTLCFFKDGKALGRVEGAMMAPKIKSMVDFSFFDGEKPTDIDTMSLADE